MMVKVQLLVHVFSQLTASSSIVLYFQYPKAEGDEQQILASTLVTEDATLNLDTSLLKIFESRIVHLRGPLDFSPEAAKPFTVGLADAAKAKSFACTAGKLAKPVLLYKNFSFDVSAALVAHCRTPAATAGGYWQDNSDAAEQTDGQNSLLVNFKLSIPGQRPFETSFLQLRKMKISLSLVVKSETFAVADVPKDGPKTFSIDVMKTNVFEMQGRKVELQGELDVTKLDYVVMTVHALGLIIDLTKVRVAKRQKKPEAGQESLAGQLVKAEALFKLEVEFLVRDVQTVVARQDEQSKVAYLLLELNEPNNLGSQLIVV